MIARIGFTVIGNRVELHVATCGATTVGVMAVDGAEMLAEQLTECIRLAREWQPAETLGEMIGRLG